MSCNVYSEYVSFSIKNLEDYSRMIMKKFFDKAIYQEYSRVYLEVRYYHMRDSVRSTLEGNLNYYLNKVYENNKGKTSLFILELFKMYYYLDGVKKFSVENELVYFINEINNVRRDKLGIDDRNFSREFKALFLLNRKRKLEFIDALDCAGFTLKQKRLVNGKYLANLDYDIKFPRLYSAFSVNKVFNTSLVAEDKLLILYYLVSKNILCDAIKGNFNREYFIGFNCDLCFKKDKLKSLFNIINNDLCLELCNICINYKDFTNNKDLIYSYIREGFKFCLVVDDEYLEYTALLDSFSYILVYDSSLVEKRILSRKNTIVV